MTSYPLARDWKVSAAYRLLVIVGWGIAALAVFFGVLAIAFGQPELWGPAAALSFGVVGLGAALPEPVPHDMLNGGSTKVSAVDR